MTKYVGIVHKDPGTCFGVSFPDFPGCISAGDTLEELELMAHEGLNFHVEGMVEMGLEIPPPGDLDQILTDPDYQDRHSIIWVTLDPSKSSPPEKS